MVCLPCEQNPPSLYYRLCSQGNHTHSEPKLGMLSSFQELTVTNRRRKEVSYIDRVLEINYYL